MAFKEVLKRRWPWFAGGGLVVLAAIGVLIAALLGAFAPASEEAAPRPVPTVEVTPEPTPTPEPKPEVDIDTTEFMPYSEVWNPPDTGENFWQVVDPDNGYPEDGGTDYVLAHACDDPDAGCAGDLVRTLESGDDLTYRGEEYVVDEKLEIHKSEIGEQDIWHHDPDRLVVITCILDLETGEFNENDIIVASRAG